MTVTLTLPALAAWIGISVAFGAVVGFAAALDWLAHRNPARLPPIRVRPSHVLPDTLILAPFPDDEWVPSEACSHAAMERHIRRLQEIGPRAVPFR